MIEILALSLVENGVIFRYYHFRIIFKMTASCLVDACEEEINSGAPAARRAAKWSPIVITGKKRKPMKDFLMVIMASGVVRGRVRTTTTTTTESRNMAVTLQKIGWQRHTALVYRVLLWYWTSGAMINWHLSKQVIRWPVSRRIMAKIDSQNRRQEKNFKSKFDIFLG